MFRRTPEIDLFLLCSRVHPSQEAASRIGALVQGERDWDRLLWLAFRNSTVPVVYENLVNRLAGDVPAGVLDALRHHVHQTAAHNIALAAGLVAVLQALSDAGVAALPLKGPVLAASLYGRLSLREFEDLDVLVDPENVEQTQAVLAGLGFDSAHPPGDRRGKHQVFRHPVSEIILELHWALFEPALRCRLDSKALWKSVVPKILLGEVVLSLGPEEQFLFLATHGWRHGWESLKWICDVAQLIRSMPNHDWKATLCRAERLGCVRIAELALGLASELLEAPLPDDLHAQVLGKAEIREWIQEIAAKITSLSTEAEPFTSEKALKGAQFTRFLMRSRDSLPDSLSLFFHTVRERLRPNPKSGEPGVAGWLRRPFALARAYGIGCVAASFKALFAGLFHW